MARVRCFGLTRQTRNTLTHGMNDISMNDGMNPTYGNRVIPVISCCLRGALLPSTNHPVSIKLFTLLKNRGKIVEIQQISSIVFRIL